MAKVLRRKAENGETGFKPIVKATTCGRHGHVEMRIRDNGTGIPPKAKEKISIHSSRPRRLAKAPGLGYL